MSAMCEHPPCDTVYTTPADYVQRYARPEQMLSRNPPQKDSDEDDDQKMEDGDESEGAFLSDSEDES